MKHKKITALLLVITVVFLIELSLRFKTSNELELPFFYDRYQRIYPELYHQTIYYNENQTNILLLGGSVLGWTYENINNDSNGNYYINVAKPAHTSLDSLYKYRYFIKHGYQFDHVVFYHGINEVRTNNINPEYFKFDYSHYSDYRLIKWVLHSRTLFFNSELIFTSYRFLNTYFNNRKTLPKHAPRADFLEYGGTINSRFSFENNLLNIVNVSRNEESILIIPVYAYNLPLNYSKESLIDGTLGYSLEDRAFPIEIWGKPEYVLKGIDAHNQVIIQNAEKYLLIDTSNISSYISNFVDVCHFSEMGKIQIISHISKSIDIQET